MGWLLVICAAVAEIIGVIGLKMFSQNQNIRNLILFAGGFGTAFGCLYASLHYLQLSIAYSVWIGVGTAGAVVVNMIFFGESRHIGRIISLVLIIIGVVGLKAVS